MDNAQLTILAQLGAARAALYDATQHAPSPAVQARWESALGELEQALSDFGQTVAHTSSCKAPAAEPIPAGVCFSVVRDTFFSTSNGFAMSQDFYTRWHHRSREFPRFGLQQALAPRGEATGLQQPATADC